MSKSSGSLDADVSPLAGLEESAILDSEDSTETSSRFLGADEVSEDASPTGNPDEATEAGPPPVTQTSVPKAEETTLTPSATLPDWLVSALPTIHSVVGDVVSAFRNADLVEGTPSDSSDSSLPSSSSANDPITTSTELASENESTDGAKGSSTMQAEESGKESSTENEGSKEGSPTDREEAGEPTKQEESTPTSSSGEPKSSSSGSPSQGKKNEETDDEDEDNTSSAKPKSPAKEESSTIEEDTSVTSAPLDSSTSNLEPSTTTENAPFLGPENLGPSEVPYTRPDLPTSSDADFESQASSPASSNVRYVILGVCLFVAILFGIIILLILRARRRRQRERYISASQLEKNLEPDSSRRRSPRYTDASFFPAMYESRRSSRTSSSAMSTRRLSSSLAIVVPNPNASHPEMSSSKSIPLAAQSSPIAPPTQRETTNDPFASPEDATAPRSPTPTDSMYSQQSAGSTVLDALAPQNRNLMQLVTGPSRT